jgi:hypothetical protein
MEASALKCGEHDFMKIQNIKEFRNSGGVFELGVG